METVRIPIKPLSANRAWRGRRFKSDEYKQYEIVLVTLFNRIKFDIPSGPVECILTIGVSPLFDLDNALKQLLDVCRKYQPSFNDRKIFHIDAYKDIVKKGDEYIEFRFEKYTKSNKDR